jgi:selenocysteine lyase/cysteine desulfurase
MTHTTHPTTPRPTEIDVPRARGETPGCEKVAHFNNAGAALMPRPVLDAVLEHLQLEALAGGYEAAELQAGRIEAVYDSIARLLNCRRDEVAVVENATRAWDMAFYAIPFQPGDRILTSVAEYASNYIAFLQVARRTGAVVEVIPNDEHGQLSLRALEALLERPAKLVAITHVPTNGGLVNPAAAVGSLARQAGALYLLDACQSIGQMPLDVTQTGCDMLSATGRKFLRGPRGTGFLYVRRELLEQLEPPFLDLHAARWVGRDAYQVRPDARRFENWETYYAGKIGLGAAVEYALGWGLEAIEARITRLAGELRRELAALPGVRVHDLGEKQCGIVTFTADGVEPQAVRAALQAQGINVSISSRAFTRLDMEQRGLEEIVRASVHYYNTGEEIERLCAVVAGIKG